MELVDERFVRELLSARYGVQLRKVPESRESGVKTFDYELLRECEPVAALEVKRIEPTPRTEENGWRRDPASGFMVRADNAPARVAAIVHKGLKQLANVSLTRVLVLLNDEHGMDALDLDEALIGSLDYGSEATGYYRNVVSAKRAAVQRIRDERWQIDLYIWVNRYEGRTTWRPSGLLPHEEFGPFFRCTTQAGYDLATGAFGVALPHGESDSTARSA